jgi:hypothetical protein
VKTDRKVVKEAGLSEKVSRCIPAKAGLYVHHFCSYNKLYIVEVDLGLCAGNYTAHITLCAFINLDTY